MAAEYAAPLTPTQRHSDQGFEDALAYSLVDSTQPGNSVLSLKYLTAREISSDAIEQLEASIAKHIREHLHVPIQQVGMSVDFLASQNMAASAGGGGPGSASTVITPKAGDEPDATGASTPTKPPKKIPRPPNAFIIYRKERHAATVAANPGMHNNQISVILGKKWKKESQEVRDFYQNKAAEAKYNHQLANPDYHYQPRKPSEKKRRMTKNKLAKLAEKSAQAASTSSAQANTMSAETSSSSAQASPLNGAHAIDHAAAVDAYNKAIQQILELTPPVNPGNVNHEQFSTDTMAENFFTGSGNSVNASDFFTLANDPSSDLLQGLATAPGLSAQTDFSSTEEVVRQSDLDVQFHQEFEDLVDWDQLFFDTQ